MSKQLLHGADVVAGFEQMRGQGMAQGVRRGGFQLAAETYLLEAKWTSPPVGAAELRSFNAKVEEKAAWSRGLFVSDSGFTPDGIAAFGRGKRVVCMDGLDLYEILDKNLLFADVMSKKVRRAAESGNPFVRVRDLYT